MDIDYAVLTTNKSLDFAQELEDLIKDYLSWGSDQSPDQRRADVIRVLEEQIVLLKTSKQLMSD